MDSPSIRCRLLTQSARHTNRLQAAAPQTSRTLGPQVKFFLTSLEAPARALHGVLVESNRRRRPSPCKLNLHKTFFIASLVLVVSKHSVVIDQMGENTRTVIQYQRDSRAMEL